LHEIEFQNFRSDVAPDNLPYISAQLGDWEIGSARELESGIVIDAAGPVEYPPILSAAAARKLAKWLNNAADALDGKVSSASKKHKKRNYYQDEYEDEDAYKF